MLLSLSKPKKFCWAFATSGPGKPKPRYWFFVRPTFVPGHQAWAFEPEPWARSTSILRRILSMKGRSTGYCKTVIQSGSLECRASFKKNDQNEKKGQFFSGVRNEGFLETWSWIKVVLSKKVSAVTNLPPMLREKCCLLLLFRFHLAFSNFANSLLRKIPIEPSWCY